VSTETTSDAPSEARKRRRFRRTPKPVVEHMTLFEHLGELRRRTFWSMAAIAIGASVVYGFFNPILTFLDGPYRNVTRSARLPDGAPLVATGVTDAFLVRLQVSAYGGIIIAAPIIVYHLWRFVTPALDRREKRYAIPLVAATALLFAMGVLVMWFVLEPAVDFLVNQSDAIQPLVTAKSYLTLVVVMALVFGIAFEFPVVIIFLLLARIVTTKQLRAVRRYVIVGIVIFAAVATPSQDPYSLFFMAGPMYVFYEVAIVVGRIMKR